MLEFRGKSEFLLYLRNISSWKNMEKVGKTWRNMEKTWENTEKCGHWPKFWGKFRNPRSRRSKELWRYQDHHQDVPKNLGMRLKNLYSWKTWKKTEEKSRKWPKFWGKTQKSTIPQNQRALEVPRNVQEVGFSPHWKPQFPLSGGPCHSLPKIPGIWALFIFHSPALAKWSRSHKVQDPRGTKKGWKRINSLFLKRRKASPFPVIDGFGMVPKGLESSQHKPLEKKHLSRADPGRENSKYLF